MKIRLIKEAFPHINRTEFLEMPAELNAFFQTVSIMFPILKKNSLTLPIYYELQYLIARSFVINIKPYIHPFYVGINNNLQ